MKTWVKNRNGKRLAVLVDQPKDSRGLAFVLHGLGGFKEQTHIIAMAKALVDAGLTTVRYDAENTIGESEGAMEAVTATRYFEDLEDVISWAKTQEWYAEPFGLCGHSLGGLTILLYAEKHPAMVQFMIPAAPVTVGSELIADKWSDEELQEMQQTGVYVQESNSRPGVEKRIGWAFVTDLRQQDATRAIAQLTHPVLMVTGTEDSAVSVASQQRFFDALPAHDKQFSTILGADHNMGRPHECDELYEIIATWIKPRLG